MGSFLHAWQVLLFTSIHIEMIKSMDTNSFILALWCFIARRGNIRSIGCNNWNHFVGEEKELEKCMNEMDNKMNGDFLLEKSWLDCVEQKSTYG